MSFIHRLARKFLSRILSKIENIVCKIHDMKDKQFHLSFMMLASNCYAQIYTCNMKFHFM